MTAKDQKKTLKAKMLSRGDKCCYCKTKLNITNFTFEHVTPKVFGGKFNEGNIVAACNTCNSENGSLLGERIKLFQLERTISNLDIQLRILSPLKVIVPTAVKELKRQREELFSKAKNTQLTLVRLLIKIKINAGYKIPKNVKVKI